MKIELRDVAKGPTRARALEPVSVVFETGTAALVEAETEQRPAVLGLIASGRMRPDAGAVLLDGAEDARAVRARTALVDAPEVCDPAPNVAVSGLVEEELMFAGRPANLLSARRWLDENGLGHLARLPISAVAPRERIALLLELTALRRRVEAMVLVSPDRHGGDPRDWWDVVEGFAARGYAMLVVAGRASATVLQNRDASDSAIQSTPSPTPPAEQPAYAGGGMSATPDSTVEPDAAADPAEQPADATDESAEPSADATDQSAEPSESTVGPDADRDAAAAASTGDVHDTDDAADTDDTASIGDTVPAAGGRPTRVHAPTLVARAGRCGGRVVP